MLRSLIFSFIFFTLITVSTCTRKQEIPVADGSTGEVPLQEFVGKTSIVMVDSGKTEWIMRTTYMVKKRNGDKTEATPVEFDYFGGKKEPQSHLTARHGETFGQTFESFFVEGNVVVTSTKGYKLKSDNLRWDKKKNQIVSDSRVHFKTLQGDMLTGIGFESDPDLENWKILKNVHGEFQNFEKRVDEGGL